MGLQVVAKASNLFVRQRCPQKRRGDSEHRAGKQKRSRRPRGNARLAQELDNRSEIEGYSSFYWIDSHFFGRVLVFEPCEENQSIETLEVSRAIADIKELLAVGKRGDAKVAVLLILHHYQKGRFWLDQVCSQFSTKRLIYLRSVDGSVLKIPCEA